MFVLLAVLCLLMKESLLLRIVHVTVPSYRVRGQPAQLECNYELGDDTLYSVKWYRDNEEFYRFMPKYDPPKHAYKLDGVKVDISKSDDRKVALHQVTLKSTGLYRCEVSAEAPSFASAAGEGRMEVIYLPREGPRITGNEQENRRGDSLFLNCTSSRSYPAAVLSWDIDGEKVTDPMLLVEYPTVQHAHGLLSSALGLRVPAGRTMQVRCTARVAPAWREGSEAVVGSGHLADSKEAMLLGRMMQVRCAAQVAPAWREGSEAVAGSGQLTDSKEAMLLVRSSSSVSTLSVILLTLSVLRVLSSLLESET